MIKKLPLLYSLFAIALASLLISFSNNPPNGRTGAPGESNTCAGCHGGNNPNGFDGGVSITGLPSTIEPNTTYPLTVTVNNPNGLATRAGFQWVALKNSDNSNAGQLANSDNNSAIMTQGNRTYHEHSPAQLFGGNTSITWTAEWTAPEATTSDETITFYAISVIGNGGGSGGDLVALSETTTLLPAAMIPLTLSITNVFDVSCNGDSDGSATASPNGGVGPYTYAWSNGATTQTISNLPAGDYEVTVTDSEGSTINSSITIEEPTPIEIQVASQTNVSCDNPTGSVFVSVNGGVPGYNLSWPNGSTGPVSDGLAPGDYTVTVTDYNGCVALFTATIEEDVEAPVADAGPNRTLTCSTTIVTLDGNASSVCPSCTYEWTTSDGNIISDADEISVQVDASGTYTLTVVDASNGCSSTSTVIVDEAPDISAQLDVLSNIACNGQATGSAGVTIDGGLEPFSILWSTGANTPTISGLLAGDYEVTVSDANGCTQTLSITVEEPDALSISIDAITNETNGQGDGAIELSVSGGAGGYTFFWTKDGDLIPDVTEDLANLSSGTYVVMVTDDNGCEISEEIVVDQVTSTAQIDQLVDYSLFPNPARTEVAIQLTLVTPQAVQLHLLNLNGQVLQQQFLAPQLEHQVNMDVSLLPKGMYLVQMSIGDGTILRKMIVE